MPIPLYPNGYSIADLTEVAGYEVPKKASKATKKLLKRLNKKGFVIFHHDDGPGLITRSELEEIAGAIGLRCFTESYQIVVFDEKYYQKQMIKG